MPFRFRKSIKLGKGIKLNLSKSGISTSIGGKGASVNLGKRGVKTTVGVPGTGLSFSSQAGLPKQQTTPQNRSKYNNSNRDGSSGCLSGVVGLVALPFRIIVDLIKSIINPDTRRSTMILIGSVSGICLLLFGGISVMNGTGSLATSSPTTFPTIPVLATNTLLPTPSTTSTNAQVFPVVSLEDYPRVATSRFQTLREATMELTEVHQQFAADPSLSQGKNWYAGVTSTLARVVSGAQELASMNNYPPEYSAFHQQMQSLAGEAILLEANYMVALDNQDMGALNQATPHLSNIITLINQGLGEVNRLAVTSTPIPTNTFIPTATVVFIPLPTSAPSSNTGFDNNGDGKVTCADFSTQAAAQQAYNAGYTQLDGSDNDGRACESLP